MHFELEAVFAKKGDALILHCGHPENDPHWILIDGGVGVWTKFLKPRLEEIREDHGFDQLPLDLVMVSHVDDDHIDGILSLMRSVARDVAPDYTVDTLWHNAFDRLLGTTSQEIVGILEAELPADAGGAASVKQGIDLTQFAKEAEAKGRLSLNKLFRGSDDFPALIVASKANVRPFAVGDSGVTFTVLAPNTSRLEAFQEEWDKELKKRKLVLQPGGAGGAASLKPLDPNDAFTFDDDSQYNLASIVVLAERDGRRMLLTGDATGNDVVEGLVLAGHLPGKALLDAAGLKADRDDPNRPVPQFHVDLLKIPHHGSPNNVTTGFFRRVTADHYVFSGNGEHGNPSPHTLGMIREARGGNACTFHFTMTEAEIRDHQKGSSANDRHEGLRRLHEWIFALRAEGAAQPRLEFRKAGKLSISVDLSTAGPD